MRQVLLFLLLLCSFLFSLLFTDVVSFGQGTAKTVKVGRIVAALRMSPLVLSFYLVIFARVLCSSLGVYMRSYGAVSYVEESRFIKDCQAAREIDRKLERVS